MRELCVLREPVNKFFEDVLVMAEDKDLRDARLTMLATLRNAIRDEIADIAQIAEERQA
jgi:glycyl-tRNA synthetase beta subunit